MIAQHIRKTLLAIGAGLAVLLCTSCASKPPLTQTGFVSDYSRLEPESDSRPAYRSGRLADYDSFIIDPVEIRVESDKFSKEDQTEAAQHFHDRLVIPQSNSLLRSAPMTRYDRDCREAEAEDLANGSGSAGPVNSNRTSGDDAQPSDSCTCLKGPQELRKENMN